VLDGARLQSLWEAAVRLEELAGQREVPAGAAIPLCGTCSLGRFCGLG